jgi:hypothetical protein
LGKLIDLTGQTFGSFLVEERATERLGKHIAWQCKCKCGAVKLVRGDELRGGQAKTCGKKGCRPALSSREKPLGHLKGLLQGARKSKKAKLGFDIDIDYLWELWMKQSMKCAISKYPMTTIKGRGWVFSNASIDRIDSSKGYVRGNVQLVIHFINRMKSNYSSEEFLFYCHLVTQNTKMPQIPGSNVRFEVKGSQSVFTVAGREAKNVQQLLDSSS